MKKPKITEDNFQSTVIEMAQWLGWKAAHFRAAQKKDGTWYTPIEADGKGFPDLVLVHEAQGRLIFAELKSDTGTCTPEQRDWLNWLSQTAKGWEVYLWKPGLLDEIEEILTLGHSPHSIERAGCRSLWKPV